MTRALSSIPSPRRHLTSAAADCGEPAPHAAARQLPVAIDEYTEFAMAKSLRTLPQYPFTSAETREFIEQSTGD